MIDFRQAPCLRGRRRNAGRTLGSMTNAPIWRMGLTQMSTTANLSSRIRNPELAFSMRLALDMPLNTNRALHGRRRCRTAP